MSARPNIDRIELKSSSKRLDPTVRRSKHAFEAGERTRSSPFPQAHATEFWSIYRLCPPKLKLHGASIGLDISRMLYVKLRSSLPRSLQKANLFESVSTFLVALCATFREG